MAKASWIPLAIGGVGSVVLISGIQGESLASVLKGEFGKEKGKPFPNPEAKPKSDTENASYVTSSGASLSPVPSGKLVSPFPKSASIRWGRNDQGVDGVTTPGTALVAMGNGIVEIAHDCSGFGCTYPVLHLENGESFYYGHTAPIVGNGTRVRAGEPIAVIPPHGQGNATTPGSFEIGKLLPGGGYPSFSSGGASIREWFIHLPRL